MWARVAGAGLGSKPTVEEMAVALVVKAMKEDTWVVVVVEYKGAAWVEARVKVVM